MCPLQLLFAILLFVHLTLTKPSLSIREAPNTRFLTSPSTYNSKAQIFS